MDDKNSTTNSFFSKSEHSTTINLQNRSKKSAPQPFLLSQFLKVQTELNQSLFNNQVLLRAYLSKENTQNQSQQPVPISVQARDSLQVLQSEKEKVPPQHQIKQLSKKKRSSRYKVYQSSQDEYQPQKQADTSRTYKVSETKNIPKNFGKAIIRFIRKNENFTGSTLKQFKMNEIKFYRMLDSYKEKINTIAELRSLWVEEENQFAKVLRILSMKYLRKHSLSHIFNSRVENHSKHIKYRLKIMKALQNPKQFTYIKDF